MPRIQWAQEDGFVTLSLSDISVLRIETWLLADFTIPPLIAADSNHSPKVTVRAGECWQGAASLIHSNFKSF